MKIDCSKTDNYFKEKIRMIAQTTGVKYCSNVNRCERCLLHKKNNPTGLSCSNFEFEYPNKAIAVVQKWSDEHSQKTYKDDFFEKFSDAKKTETGYPKVIPCNVYQELKEQCHECCDFRICMDCWDMVMEE